jgi:hypothetical protein
MRQETGEGLPVLAECPRERMLHGYAVSKMRSGDVGINEEASPGAGMCWVGTLALIGLSRGSVNSVSREGDSPGVALLAVARELVGRCQNGTVDKASERHNGRRVFARDGVDGA